MFGRISLVLCLAVTASCGGGDDPPAGVDAAGSGSGIDAAPASVLAVEPCTGESATIESTGGFRFAPNTATITAGQIIKFTNGSTHSIVPVMPMSDSGFTVGFGATKCLRFTKAGTFNYRCNPHTSMTGSITVN